jgi:hypothetical protein
MQHWHVYRKWNYKLTNDVTAYKQGRMGGPFDIWYKGELGFDNYITHLRKVEGLQRGLVPERRVPYRASIRQEWETREIQPTRNKSKLRQ